MNNDFTYLILDIQIRRRSKHDFKPGLQYSAVRSIKLLFFTGKKRDKKLPVYTTFAAGLVMAKVNRNMLKQFLIIYNREWSHGGKVRDQNRRIQQCKTVHFSSSSFIPRKKIKNKRQEK